MGNTAGIYEADGRVYDMPDTSQIYFPVDDSLLLPEKGAKIKPPAPAETPKTDPNETLPNIPPTSPSKTKDPKALSQSELLAKLESVYYIPFEEALKLVQPTIDQLNQLTLVEDKMARTGAAFLDYYCNRQHGDKYVTWVDKLIECKFVDAVARLWPLYMIPDFVPMGSSAPRSDTWISIRCFLSSCWNASDLSIPLCQQITTSGILEHLMALLNRTDIDPTKLSSSAHKKWLAQAAQGILHNCIRRPDGLARIRVRQNDMLSVMKRYLSCNVAMNRTLASIIIAYTVNEDEMGLVDTNDDIIGMIVQLLQQATKSSDGRARGFAVDELIDAANQLAKHDSNKHRMISAGIVPVYAQIIKDPKSTEELVYAVKGVWILSFTEDGKKAIKNVPDYDKELKRLSTHENGRVAKSAAGALMNIVGIDEKKKEKIQKEQSNQSHIMLSYDHQHKEVVHHLSAKLKAAGYPTWLDAEQMHGSTLDAMAAAVENASVILMCWSERYQNSVNCRSEAEYAYKLNKPMVPIRTEKYQPTGWLNMLLASKYYVTCITAQEVDERFEEVCRQLGALLDELGGAPVAAKPGATPSASTPAPASRSNFEKWSQSEVQDWLKKNQMGHLTATFSKFDGGLLYQLRVMQRSTPALFIETVKGFLNVQDLADILKLIKEMELL